MHNKQRGFIYKWTNIVNGKWYIGSRKGTTDDGYRHSSKVLKLAEEKYGLENFTREILFEGDYEKDQIRSVVEARYLNEEGAANNPISYNQTNITGPDCFSEESKRKQSLKLKGKSNPAKGQTYDEIYGTEKSSTLREHLSELRKGKTYEELYGEEKAHLIKQDIAQKATGRKRKPHTEEAKQKISDAVKGRIPWNKGKKGVQVAWNKDKPWSQEMRSKISKGVQGKNNKAVLIDNTHYPSQLIASKSYKVSPETIRYWIKTGRAKCLAEK